MKSISPHKKYRYAGVSGRAKEMLIVGAMVVLPVIFPGTVHASILSFFTSFAGRTVSAQETTGTNTPGNSQTMPILTNDGSNSNSEASDSIDAPIISDGAFVALVGPAGSIEDLDNQPTNITPSFYVVQKNDTISLVSQMFGVSVGTIESANSLTNPTISPGQVLVIPPVSGLSYIVKKGDDISSIIAKYKVDLGDVLEYNDMSATSTMLAVGDSIFLPGADTSSVATASPRKTSRTSAESLYEPLIPGDGGPVIPGYYACPVHGSWLSQGLHGHNAVDLALGIGNPIDAAADGTVIIARSGGWNGGYGNYVVISHPNGTETLYAHAEKLFVTAGEKVTQGQEIAKIGLTGETTGPHLHFEVRGAANPFLTIKC